ncbi:hypothetical protein N7478_004320 [Penicillium angulare]|uniref:uncharacterized protein n=1 Tax=Penicillium angulare TaxID=116970 RepID=UPI0025408871|nr:uncharacterized protein N7478_004320 [Penicillium angulare]KAJ5278948.1 hypothetical protein N7478_004320 [Penicillium angulare]
MAYLSLKRTKPALQSNDDPVVEVVERNRLDDFGFMVFRTDYSNAQRWEQWDKKFHQRLDASLKRASGGTKIEDKCLIPNYEDEDLHNADYHQIQRAFKGFWDNEGVPPGLDTGICLVVDRVAMESMANNKPWVYALDLSFDHRIRVPNGEYSGYFRVAVDSILPELYPMLTAMSPQQLWPSDNRIWESEVH